MFVSRGRSIFMSIILGLLLAPVGVMRAAEAPLEVVSEPVAATEVAPVATTSSEGAMQTESKAEPPTPITEPTPVAQGAVVESDSEMVLVPAAATSPEPAAELPTSTPEAETVQPTSSVATPPADKPTDSAPTATSATGPVSDATTDQSAKKDVSAPPAAPVAEPGRGGSPVPTTVVVPASQTKPAALPVVKPESAPAAEGLVAAEAVTATELVAPVSAPPVLASAPTVLPSAVVPTEVPIIAPVAESPLAEIGRNIMQAAVALLPTQSANTAMVPAAIQPILPMSRPLLGNTSRELYPLAAADVVWKLSLGVGLVSIGLLLMAFPMLGLTAMFSPGRYANLRRRFGQIDL